MLPALGPLPRRFLRRAFSTDPISSPQSVVIVGGGPAGLTAGLYAGRAQLRPLILTGGSHSPYVPGGQLMLTTDVENFPGVPDPIPGPTLINHMQHQAQSAGAHLLSRFATSLQSLPNGSFRVTLGSGPQFSPADSAVLTAAVIVATGASARWLALPHEARFRNRGVSVCAVCDGPLPMFRDGDLLVVGGGDSACEEALFLTHMARSVTLVHRRGVLRASKLMAQRVLQHPKIKVRWDTEVVQYHGEDLLQAVTLRNVKDGKEEIVETKGLFIAIGHDPATEWLKGSGVELGEDGYVMARQNVMTNVEGVFCAGDCHDRHFRQAVTAAGFGCMAALAAERFIDGTVPYGTS